MRIGRRRIGISGTGDSRCLLVAAPAASLLEGFEGTAAESATGHVLEGPLSAVNAAAVRAAVPGLRPRPVGLAVSAGVGDRLGLATPGQAQAFRDRGEGIFPIFAQQSIREMDRLGRTPQNVLDDATFGLLEAGWDRPVGADADHLKTTDDIDRCLEAGFTLFTLDPGEHVRRVPADGARQALAELPWEHLEDDAASMFRRYAEVRVDAGGREIRVGEDEVARAAAKYGAAVAYTVAMYRHLRERAAYPVEAEVSVDETDEVTTVAEHLYLAMEMKRLGMEWVSFAPRYLGDFEKGVDYIGRPEDLFDSLVQHAAIARSVGPYKLSLHSGSDKYSIYELANEATRGLVHLKTSGTSYLVALDIAARFSPELFRRIYETSREAYRGARSSYQVSAALERTPEPAIVSDAQLAGLVTAFDSRQILHVGYGAVLRTDSGQESSLAHSLRELLGTRAEEYRAALADHLGRHLGPFSKAPNGGGHE